VIRFQSTDYKADSYFPAFWVTRSGSPQGFTGFQTNAAQTPFKFMNETDCFTARLSPDLPAQIHYKWSENNSAKFVHILYSYVSAAYIN